MRVGDSLVLVEAGVGMKSNVSHLLGLGSSKNGRLFDKNPVTLRKIEKNALKRRVRSDGGVIMQSV